MEDYGEYEFILPDGTVRYEIVSCRQDVFVLKAMHGAVSARPVQHADPDGSGTCGAGPDRRQELLEEMADLERRYFAEGVESGKDGSLLSHLPLRTARASFPAHGSSLSKAPLDRSHQFTVPGFTVDLPVAVGMQQHKIG